VEFSSNLSSIYTKLCAQTYPLIFGLFAIFDRNFAKLMAPTSDKNENYVVHLKEQSLLEKAENRVETETQCLFELRTPRTNSAPASERDQKNKNKKHHIFAPTAGARCTFFPKTLHGVRARRAYQKRRQSFFDPTLSFSYRLNGKIWPN